jgi:hypothetical protein
LTVTQSGFEELERVRVLKTVTATDLMGEDVKIKEGWEGTVLCDCDTPAPFVEFVSDYREPPSEEPILANIEASNLEKLAGEEES